MSLPPDWEKLVLHTRQSSIVVDRTHKGALTVFTANLTLHYIITRATFNTPFDFRMDLESLLRQLRKVKGLPK